jgi:3D-(3,5/4)-trihydroxycyclohexane-1,2-dione acylhydrolase (decyclizing)
MRTERLTTAQALIRFLAAQYVERDGDRSRFFAGCFGIFGHGNLAGIGQALQQYHGTNQGLQYVPARNEQAMVHAAIAHAKHLRRRSAWACTSSIGPGATNMVTGAATATINRLPVLLLPGDTFAGRRVDPVLQQLEHPLERDVTVNDCFRPVSRMFDRITRPEQIIASLPEAMRVLTDAAETGAVTIALPQDVQAEAYDYPVELFTERTWSMEPTWPEEGPVRAAAELLRNAHRPVLVIGGGAAYADATIQLAAFATMSGIPVVETQAGKGALPSDHPCNLGAAGATGTSAANAVLATADVVIGVGTRWSDFTTASHTAFADNVRFININTNRADAHKLGAVPVIADAGVAFEALWAELGYDVTMQDGDLVLPDLPPLIDADYARQLAQLRDAWVAERARVAPEPADVQQAEGQLPSQGEVIGAVNSYTRSVEREGRCAPVICAAGSLPGDLHKLWRTNMPGGYHMEYGYSCMGYEVAAGLGVALADPEVEPIVMVGDGSWLMLSSEIVTAVQEGVSFTVVLVDNGGYGSIGALSASLGSDGFGTQRVYRTGTGTPGGDGGLAGDVVPVDFVANAASMGAHAVQCNSIDELVRALHAPRPDVPRVLVVRTDSTRRVPSYESWWDVPVAEVSSMESVQRARADWEQAQAREQWLV